MNFLEWLIKLFRRRKNATGVGRLASGPTSVTAAGSVAPGYVSVTGTGRLRAAPPRVSASSRLAHASDITDLGTTAELFCLAAGLVGAGVVRSKLAVWDTGSTVLITASSASVAGFGARTVANIKPVNILSSQPTVVSGGNAAARTGAGAPAQSAATIVSTGRRGSVGTGAATSVAPTVNSSQVIAWQTTIATQELTQNGTGQTVDLDSLLAYGAPAKFALEDGSSLPTGMTLDGNTGVISGTPTVLQSVSPAIWAAPTRAEADFYARANGPGVVWFNGFESDGEVNAYRWAGGLGNDPNAAHADAGAMTRLATGGPGGLPALEILHSGASSAPNVNWWRPMSPMAAPGNGRTSNDPGSGKTIRTWAPTQGGSQTQNWNQDFWGPQTYPQEFYFQLRVKRDPRRVSPSYNAAESVGKLLFLSLTSNSLTAQEIVTYSGSGGGSGGTTNDFHRMYVGGSPPMESLDPLGRSGQQVGGQLSSYPSNYCDVTANPSKCWSFSGGWDTLLYHITPGTFTSGSGLSTIRVYAAREGVTSYTKIWDQQFTHSWQTSTTKGWNAVILNTYQNNTAFPGPFWQRYAQLIFSTQFISCPKV